MQFVSKWVDETGDYCTTKLDDTSLEKCEKTCLNDPECKSLTVDLVQDWCKLCKHNFRHDVNINNPMSTYENKVHFQKVCSSKL